MQSLFISILKASLCLYFNDMIKALLSRNSNDIQSLMVDQFYSLLFSALLQIHAYGGEVAFGDGGKCFGRQIIVKHI